MGQPLTILIIEDNPADARLIREFLAEAEDAVFGTLEAATLSAGMEILERQDCDMVLLDLSLPDSMGLETLHHVHAHAPNIPIIVLTGLDDDLLALTAMRHGAQDYLLKGKFDLSLLTRVIRYTMERKKAESEIRKLAYYDTLTGLPNRILFYDRLKQYLGHAHRENHVVALIFLDLDRFKVVNDSLGHANGDLLLQEVARRLDESVRVSDTVARLGGDEFVIALQSVPRGETLGRVASNILTVVSEPVIIDGHEICTSCSIGIALYPDDGDTADDLMKNSDIAMYQAKEQGRNTYQFFSSEMNRKAFARQMLENQLRKALSRNELFLAYQPQIDVPTGGIAGIEALVRWNHPERGIISPKEFIPLAEETGLILPIGAWVLRTACAQSRAWQLKGLQPVRIAVNISGRQFKHTSIVGTVRQVLQETGLDPHLLELELTESTIMTEPATVVPVLHSLKELGVQLSIDDFGTGYSSLSCLKHFPINRLKIDQSFIDGIDRNADDAAIVEAIINMARSLRIETVAEGVEHARQLAFLSARNCSMMQGYYFSKPLTADECEELLATGFRKTQSDGINDAFEPASKLLA